LFKDALPYSNFKYTNFFENEALRYIKNAELIKL